MKDHHQALTGFPAIITIPLLWGDQDAFGHVNNVVYLKWAETARVDYMLRIAHWPALPPQSLGPILANINCDYRLPLTYPDKVHIGTRVAKIGNSSIRIEHVLVSHNEDTVAAEISSVLVMLDYSIGKTVRVPDEMRQAIEKFQTATAI